MRGAQHKNANKQHKNANKRHKNANKRHKNANKRHKNANKEHIMFVNPYLHFRGNAGKAFHFYEKALGGKELMVMTYGDAPGAEKTPPEMKGRVMHGQLKVGDSLLMGADGPEAKE